MADEFTMAPLSGEIMAGRAAPRGGGRWNVAPDVIVDADFETVARVGRRETHSARVETVAPPEVRPALGQERASTPVSSAADLRGMNVLRGGDLPATPGPSRRGGAGFWLAGLSLAAAAFWFSGGHSLARHAAALAGGPAEPYRVTSLVSRIETVGAAQMLFVEGEVASASAGDRRAPDLTIQVTAADGGIARYKLGTATQAAAGQASWRFSSRLEAPRSGVRSVSVTVVPEG